MKQVQLKNDPAKLHRILGGKLYSSPHSFIKECIQNAVDASIKIGQKKPIEVDFSIVGRSMFLNIRDFGCSFESIEDFEKKICTILESGKSQEKTGNEDEEMGYYGLGSMSPASFNSTWEYTVYKDGKEFHVTMKFDEDRGMLYKIGNYTPTSEEDGVLFKIKVGDVGDYHDQRSLYDLVSFMRQELFYFEGIIYSISDDILRNMNNYYSQPMIEALVTLNSCKISRWKDFQVSTAYAMNGGLMHLTYGQYIYEIEWNKLGITGIQIPVALRVGLDEGIEPNPTREKLYFNDTYKKVVKEKIQAFFDWVSSTQNKMRETNVSVQQYFEFLKSRYIELDFGVTKIQVDKNVIPKALLSSIKLDCGIVEGISDEELKRVFHKTFSVAHGLEITSTLKNGKNRKVTATLNYILSEQTGKISGNAILYYHKEAIPKWKIKKVAELHPGKIVHFVKKKKLTFKPFSKFRSGSDISTFLLTGILSADWKYHYKVTGENLARKYISEYFKVLDRYISEEFIDIESLSVVKDAPVKRVKVKKAKVVKGDEEVIVPYARKAKTGTYACVFEPETYKVSELKKLKYITVYGEKDTRDKLDFIYRVYQTYSGLNIKVSMMEEKEIKEVVDVKNFIHVDRLLSGGNRAFSKIATLLILQKELEPRLSLLGYENVIKDHISDDLYEDIKKLKSYLTKASGSSVEWRHSMSTLDYYSVISSFRYMKEKHDFVNTIIGLSLEKKIYDHDIIYTLSRVVRDLDRLDFLSYFCSSDGTVDDKAVPYIRQFCKFNKVKMDLKYYTLKDVEIGKLPIVKKVETTTKITEHLKREKVCQMT